MDLILQHFDPVSKERAHDTHGLPRCHVFLISKPRQSQDHSLTRKTDVCLAIGSSQFMGVDP